MYTSNVLCVYNRLQAISEGGKKNLVVQLLNSQLISTVQKRAIYETKRCGLALLFCYYLPHLVKLLLMSQLSKYLKIPESNYF